MPSSDADVVSLPAMAASSQDFAFVSWDGSNGRRACPLATFGSREVQVLNVRLACAEPPRADQPELKNATELRGTIALVVRGGCSFAHKARLLQRAGAVAMLLANNTREEPLAAFTMGESLEELEEKKANEAESIAMPCVMMCLRDVRELFQKFPPSVKTGELNFEILQSGEGAVAAEQCLRVQRELHEAAEAGKGWKAIKRTTTSIIKLLEPQTASGSTTVEALNRAGDEPLKPVEGDADVASSQENLPPLLGFVQWATSASTYEICFAPLADFCSARAGASYTGKLVACDPLMADKPLRNEEQLSGAVALLRRGSCSFPEKLERVQRAGAVAAIVCNDDEEDRDAAFVMSVDHIDAANATLPAVMISHSGFLRIQPALNGTTARILCQAGGAADGLLASSGQSVSFTALQMPSPRQISTKDSESNDAPVLDPLFDLHVACRDGDHGACQQILSGFVNEDAKYELVNASCPSNGLAALHHACATGNDNVVEFLLQLGAVPNALDLAMQTPLHIACAHSHAKCAQLLLRAEGSAAQVPAVLYNADEEYGGLATRRHIGGATAMHVAARAGSAECIELLLACNARMLWTTEQDTQLSKYVFLGVNAKDVEESTPLHMACKYAHAECAMYLIAANADVNSKDSTGRSPLHLSCEAVNDPTKEVEAIQIVDKLICSGAVAEVQEEEDNPVASSGSGRLLLDNVESPILRRELEVMYLRNESRTARLANDRLQKESVAVNEHVRNLEAKFAGLQRQVVEHEKYRYQLEHLQMQMTLHFQSCSGVPPSSTAMNGTVIVATTSHPEELAGKNEEELALDAALARDLGKRCSRQNQFQLAVKYFQQSLDLLPLPGVRKLLDTARKDQQKCTSDDSTTETANDSHSPTGDTASSCTKSARIRQLQELVEAVPATPQARALLNRELSKLDDLPGNAAEFSAACRWMEWLVALPWGNPHFGLQIEEVYATKRSAFEQLDKIEAVQHEVHQIQAACVIQRAFRKRYAVHLRIRAIAAVQIQATVRGYLARKQCELARRQHPTERKLLTSSQPEHPVVPSSHLDYGIMIDPAMKTKLRRGYHVKRLVVGYQFPSQERRNGMDNFVVAQLVECAATGVSGDRTGYLTSFGAFDKTTSSSFFFVWNRWGTNLEKMCECSLSGPYEDQEDAEHRLNRVIQEGKRLERCTTAELETSSFSFLRNIVGASWGNAGGVASA